MCGTLKDLTFTDFMDIGSKIDKLFVRKLDMDVRVYVFLDDTESLYCRIMLSDVDDPHKYVAEFSMSDVPGTNYVLSHSLRVMPFYEGKGIAQLLMGVKEYICKDCGIELMLCTVISSNSPELHILEKFGWEKKCNLTPQVELWSKKL